MYVDGVGRRPPNVAATNPSTTVPPVTGDDAHSCDLVHLAGWSSL